MSEEWRPIAGFERDYEVSSLGRVRSLTRGVPHWRGGQRFIPGRLLLAHNVKGYPRVNLRKAEQTRQAPVHRLVAEAFLPNPDSHPTVNHKDGNKENAAADNLEWASYSANNTHAFQAGLRSNRGERASRAAISETDVVEIRRRLADGETCVAIARDYPVSDRAISRIKRRVVWSHI